MNNGSPIYTYCLSRAGLSLDKGLKGLGGDPLYLIPWRGVAAVVSHARGEAYPPTTENVLLHGKIVEEIQTLSPVIPMRFFSLLEKEEDVKEFLKKHYNVLEGHLQRVEGKYEISIRLISPLPQKTSNQTINTPSSGEEYLLQRRRFYEQKDNLDKRQEEMVETLSDGLRPHWEERHAECQYQKNVSLISLYFLVKKDKLKSFVRAYGDLKKTHAGLKLLLSGPWPPYNFVPPELKGLKGENNISEKIM